MKKKWFIRTLLTFLLIADLVLQPVPLSMMQTSTVVSSAAEVEEESKEDVEAKRQEEEERKKQEEEEKKRREEETRKQEEAEKKQEKKEQAGKKADAVDSGNPDNKDNPDSRSGGEEEQVKTKESSGTDTGKSTADTPDGRTDAENRDVTEEKTEEKTFEIVFKAEDGGSLALSSDPGDAKDEIRQTVRDGEKSEKVKAVAAQGYKFRKWTKDGDTYSDDIEIRVEAEKAEYIAWFEEDVEETREAQGTGSDPAAGAPAKTEGDDSDDEEDAQAQPDADEEVTGENADEAGTETAADENADEAGTEPAAAENAGEAGAEAADVVPAALPAEPAAEGKPAVIYTVIFDANGHGTAPEAVTAEQGTSITEPAAPSEAGYTFTGWYKDAATTEGWDFSADKVTEDITLYAGWLEEAPAVMLGAADQSAGTYNIEYLDRSDWYDGYPPDGDYMTGNWPETTTAVAGKVVSLPSIIRGPHPVEKLFGEGYVTYTWEWVSVVPRGYHNSDTENILDKSTGTFVMPESDVIVIGMWVYGESIQIFPHDADHGRAYCDGVNASYSVSTWATVTAVPDRGYRFVGWRNGDENGPTGPIVSTQNPWRFQVTYDTRYTRYYPVFEIRPPGKIKVVNGTANKTAALEGMTVEITADDPPARDDFNHWVFDKWVAETSEPATVRFTDANSPETTFEMPGPDVTITATYVKACKIWADSEPEGAPVTGGGEYKVGETVTLTAPSWDGYKYLGWWGPGEYVTYSKTYSFPAERDRIFTARYEKLPTITVQDSEGGTGSANRSYADAGQRVTLTATQNGGWRFDYWEVISGDVRLADPSSAETTFTLASNNEDVVVKPHFYHVDVVIVITPITVQESEGGTGTADPAYTNYAGEEIKLTAIPKGASWIFDHWEVISGGITLDDPNSAETTFISNGNAVVVKPHFERLQVVITMVPVTYRVVNGTWEDGTTEDKTEYILTGLKAPAVPTGMIAGKGFTGGSWDVDPNDAVITGATTFTYTFDAAADPSGKQDIDLDVTVSDVVYGEKTVITVSASVDGEYLLDLDGRHHIVTVENGQGSFEAGRLDAGIYRAIVRFDGNDEYESASVEKRFRVNRAEVDLEVTVHDAVYPDEIECIVSASRDGDYSLEIAEQSATVTVKGGLGSYSAGTLEVGTYQAVVTWDGDRNHNPAYAITTFPVYPAGTNFSVKADPSEVTEGDTVTIIPTLPDDATGTVKYYLGTSAEGESLGETPVGESLELSTENGNALPAGTHAITASYSGDHNYIPADRTVLVVVNYVPVDVVGVVEWADNDNTSGGRPDSVTVQLVANSEEIDSKEVKEGESGLWVFSFDDLPVVDSQWREKIVYDIRADEVPGYEAEVERRGEGDYAFTVKFTAMPPAEKPKLTITAKDQTCTYNDQTQGEGDTAYDDPAQITDKVKVEGLRDGDLLASVVLDGQGTDAGEYEITVGNASIVNAAGDGVTDDYVIEYVPGTLTIEPVKATITVDSASKVVGEPDPTAFTGKVEGLLADGDLGEIKYVRTGIEEAPGTYKGVLTAQYTKNKNYVVTVKEGDFTIKNIFTLKWLDGDGSVLQERTYVEGEETPAFDGKEPAKAATSQYTYKFFGWDDGTVDGTTTTYKPLFDETVRQYKDTVTPVPAPVEKGTLTFDLGGGTLNGRTGTITIEANVGDTIKLPGAPTRTGYTFQYWKGSRYEAGADYKVEGNHTFTAVWEKEKEEKEEKEEKKENKAKKDSSGSDSSAKKNKTKGGKSGTGSKSPATGDQNRTGLWLILAAASLLGLILAVVSKKHSR